MKSEQRRAGTDRALGGWHLVQYFHERNRKFTIDCRTIGVKPVLPVYEESSTLVVTFLFSLALLVANSEISRLLVLGPDKDRNLAVVARLCGLCGDFYSDDESGVAVLNLQTKYYQARVEIHMHQVVDENLEPTLVHELPDYEAVIFVVERGQQENCLRYAKRIVDTHAYDVRLLVSTTTESGKQMESRWQDYGFELVVLDWTEHTSNEDNVLDEKQGIERVLEALQCNVWRSMEITASKRATAVTRKVTREDVRSKSDDVEKKKSQALEKENNAQGQSHFMHDSRLQTLLQALEIAGGDKGGDDHENDVNLDEFSALISEVRNVRDQGELLTDEQRRNRAAEVAIKLWNLLGKEDSDSD